MAQVFICNYNKITLNRLFIGVCIFSISFLVNAQTLNLPSAKASHTNERSLTQVVYQAVHWHPSIGQATGLLAQRQERIKIARAGYYPKIQGGLRSGYDNNFNEEKTTQTAVLSLSQMLYDFGKVSSEVKAANAGVAIGQANLLYTIDQVTRDTAQAALEIQRYQQLTRIAEEQLAGIARILALAEQRNTSGASTRSDTVQAQSRYEGAQVTLLQYSAHLQRWKAYVASLVGEQEPISIDEQFPAHLLLSCEHANADPHNVPEFLVALAQQQEAHAQRRLARAENRPTISLDPSLTHYLDDSYQYGTTRERTQWGVFLNVNMPLYQGGSNRARERVADQALRTAELALESARLNIRQGLLQAFSQTTSLARSLDSLARRDLSISETRDLYRQQYLELGTRTLLDLLNAEQEIHQSRFERQNTIADLRRLQIDCLYNTGALRDAFSLAQNPIQGVSITP